MGQILSSTRRHTHANDPTVTSFSSSPGAATGKVAVNETLERRRFFHGLARSLETGASVRPGLPLELVIHILRLANCLLPSPRLSISADAECRAAAHSAEIHRTSWFSTPPIDRHLLSRIAAVQLLTTSRDQGWTSDPDTGSWSWFEIAILSAHEGERLKLKKNEIDGQDLVWTSHFNLIAGREFSRLEGRVFDREHEIWGHLAEGDVIEIRACAQFGGWSNHAQEGLLKVMEWFEPTLPPRLGNRLSKQ